MSMRALHAQRAARKLGVEMETPRLPPPRTKEQEKALLMYTYEDVMHGQNVTIKRYELIGRCPSYDASVFDSGHMDFSDD